jgi:hypothetical protein
LRAQPARCHLRVTVRVRVGVRLRGRARPTRQLPS